MAARDDVRNIIKQEYGLSSDPLEAELGLAADPAARQQQLFAEGGSLMQELMKRRQAQVQYENEESTTAMLDPNYWSGMKRHLGERPDIAGAEMMSGMTGERVGPLGGKSEIQRDIGEVAVQQDPQSWFGRQAMGTDREELEDYFRSREMTSRNDPNLSKGMKAQLETAGNIADIVSGTTAGIVGSMSKAGRQATKIGRLSPRRRGTVADKVGTKPNKAMRDRVRKEMRQEFADPTTGESIQEGVRIPDSLVEQRIREDRLKLAMLSERVEASIGEKPWRAAMFQGEEPFKGGASYVEGIGMEEGSTLLKPSEITVGEANLRKMSKAAQSKQLKHEGGHGATFGLQRQAPATQAWRQGEQELIERIHAEKMVRKHGGKPRNMDELMDYHGELERGMQEEITEGLGASQQAGRELKALNDADLLQPYRPTDVTGQMRHGPDEGIADLFQMMIEHPEQLTPTVRQLLIDAGFKL